MRSPEESTRNAEVIILAAINDLKSMLSALEDARLFPGPDEIWDAGQGLLGIGSEVSEYGNSLLKSFSEIETYQDLQEIHKLDADIICQL